MGRGNGEITIDEVERSALSGAFELIDPGERVLKNFKEANQRMRYNAEWKDALHDLILDPFAADLVVQMANDPLVEELAKRVVERIFDDDGARRSAAYCQARTVSRLLGAAKTACQLPTSEDSDRVMIEAISEESWRGFVEAWQIVSRSSDRERAIAELEIAALDYAHREVGLQVASEMLRRGRYGNFEYLFFRNATVHSDLDTAQALGDKVAAEYSADTFPWPEEHELATLIGRAIGGINPIATAAPSELETRMTRLLSNRVLSAA